MKNRWTVLLLFLSLFLSVGSGGAQTLTADPGPTPVPALKLGGEIGFGADESDFGLSALLRYWLTDQTALDLLGSVENDSGSGALGLTQNLAHPSRDLFIQGLARVTVERLVYNDSYFPDYTSLSFTLGIGFEAFMPFCESLSLSGWIGAKVYNQWNAQYNWIHVDTVTNGLGSPVNLSFHVYF